MIASGSHLLFGTLALSRPLDEALAAWTAAHPAADELEARDLAWWIECVTRLEGNELTIYEEARSSYGKVELLRTLIDAFAAIAQAGNVELQHLDNGVHVYRWTVRDGIATTATEERKRATAPKLTAAARSYFDSKAREIEERYANRSTDELLRELIATTRTARVINLHGGTPEQRRRLAEVLHRAHRPGAALGADIGSVDGLFVSDVTALSPEQQFALREALAEADACHAYLGAATDPGEAVDACTFRADLYYRISAGPVWRLDEHADLEAALARLA